MTMGLKIHKMMKEDADTPKLREEAKRRRDMSDSILEIIYNRIMHKKPRSDILEDEIEENEDNSCD